MAAGPGPSGACEGPWGAGLTAPGPAVQRWGPGLLLCQGSPGKRRSVEGKDPGLERGVSGQSGFSPAEVDGPQRGTSLKHFGDMLWQIITRGFMSRLCAICRVQLHPKAGECTAEDEYCAFTCCCGRCLEVRGRSLLLCLQWENQRKWH